MRGIAISLLLCGGAAAMPVPGGLERAATALTQAAEAYDDPFGAAVARTLAAAIRRHQGKLAAAEALLAPVEKLQGIPALSGQARSELAELWLAQGRLRDAAGVAGTPRLAYALAMARGELDEAQRLAESLPRDPHGLLARGDVKRAQADFNGAEADYREALALQGGDDVGAARTRLAIADLRIDDKWGEHAAREALTATLVFWREDLTADLARALAATALGFYWSSDHQRAASSAAGARLALASVEDFMGRRLVLLQIGRVEKDAKAMRTVRSEARAAGFVLLEWEASLDLARLEAEPGAVLRKQAWARGLRRVGLLALPTEK